MQPWKNIKMQVTAVTKQKTREGNSICRSAGKSFSGGKVSGEEWGQAVSPRRPGCSFVPPTVNKFQGLQVKTPTAVRSSVSPTPSHTTPLRSALLCSAGTWLTAADQAPLGFLQHQQWEERLKPPVIPEIFIGLSHPGLHK